MKSQYREKTIPESVVVNEAVQAFERGKYALLS